MNRRVLAVLLVAVVVLVGAAGCSTHSKQAAMAGAAAGAAIGYGFGGNGMAAAAGAGIGLLSGGIIGGIADMFESRAEADARQAAAQVRAVGVTSCTRQERWENGKLVVDMQNCTSAMDRAGFRGDPMPPTAPMPAVRYEPVSVVIKAYPSDTVTVAPTPPPSPPGPPAPPRPL